MSGGRIANTMPPAGLKTGATVERIESARTSWMDSHKYPRDNPNMAWIALVTAAEHLIPPDHRIVGPEQIAAIGRALEWICDFVDWELSFDKADFDALKAITEDPS